MGGTESEKVNCEIEGTKKEENGIEKKENESKSGGWSQKEEKESEEEKEEERKRNTPACNCDRALATEKIIVGLPYEVIQDMCSSACRVRFLLYIKLIDYY